MGSRIPEVVDLTSNVPHQTSSASTSTPSFASSSQQPLRGIKRRRTNQHPSSSRSSSEIFLGAEEVETIDITGDNDANELAKTVAKQREDAIKAQQPTEKSDRPRTALMAYKCPICMDTPVDATTTVCGHLFCHKCIVDYLRITEENRNDSNPSSTKQIKGNCPVCRKPISRKEQPSKGRTLIPICFKIHTKTRSELEALQTKKDEEE